MGKKEKFVEERNKVVMKPVARIAAEAATTVTTAPQ